MGFQNITDIEQALSSGSVSVRDLHAAFEQRLPIADPGEHRKLDGSVGPAKQIAWLQDISLGRLFTKHALEKEEFLLVLDAAQEILRLPPDDDKDRATLVRVRMDYAAALSRLGFTRRARGELEPYANAEALGQKLKIDLLLLLGDIAREESHHAAARAAQLQTAQEALGFYLRALEFDPKRLEALVLTAATSLTLSETRQALREQAHNKARDVLAVTKALEDEEGTGFQTTWARATAHTVLGDVEAAARSYGELQRIDGVTTAQLAEARFRAQFLAEALGKPRDFFRPAFPPLQLIVFAGHLPDRPGSRARFPPASIEPVREALRAKLDTLRARVGLVSASAGADLLFIEALRARQGTVHVVLPWSQDEFLRTSVRPFDAPGSPPLWEPLFEKSIQEAATIRTIGQVYEPGSDVGWEYMMEVSAGIALHTARASRLDVQPMVLWDGLPGRGAGGTDSFHAFWRDQLQQQPIVLTPPVPRHEDGTGIGGAQSRRSERSTLHQEVQSVLFADIVGYSKLTEKAIPEFVGTFLERVSRLVALSRHAPCSVNTWGDAVYAVFDFAHDAGLFALELIRMIQEGEAEWLSKGLYWEEQVGDQPEPVKRPLNIRIGLHTGPVVLHYDPVVRRLGFTGAHVNRAARIEPVAKPGEVFASEEFAAMAELGSEIQRRQPGEGAGRGSGGDPGFVCEYAGSMQLAKGYPGRHRIYRVVRKRVFDLEELAKAAHESYCEECRRRGDSPQANSSLRPWDELSEDLRDANRAQVADIPNKLRLLGFELAPGHGTRPSEIPMTDGQVEALAMREHGRWMAERQRSGWTYGPIRDNARKHHPLLVPWDQLPEPEKDKDRDVIRDLPARVEQAGFRVRPVAR